MKISTFILVLAFLLKVSSVGAQEYLKIGHVNIQELVQQLPETDSIQEV